MIKLEFQVVQRNRLEMHAKLCPISIGVSTFYFRRQAVLTTFHRLFTLLSYIEIYKMYTKTESGSVISPICHVSFETLLQR